MRGPPRPFSIIRTLTVGFGVAPNLLTLLPKGFQEKALAGLGCFALTAGGEFRPALRTSAARYGRPFGELCRSAAPPASRFAMGNPHAPMPQRHFCKSGHRFCERDMRYLLLGAFSGGQPVSTWPERSRPDPPDANPARRTRAPRIRFRFVLMATVNTREELWTSGALPVDGLRVRLRGFRKSHHLIPAGPKLQGVAVGSGAPDKRVSACRVRRQHRI